jgi:acyl carrier protein
MSHRAPATIAEPYIEIDRVAMTNEAYGQPAAPTQRRSALSIEQWLTTEIAARLGVEHGELDPEVPLMDYGLDSFHATTLSGDLGRFVGHELSPSLLWECPTIRALSREIATEGSGPTRVAGAADEAAAPTCDPTNATGCDQELTCDPNPK